MSQYGAYGYAKHGFDVRPDPDPLLHGDHDRDDRRPERARPAPRRRGRRLVQRCQLGLRGDPEARARATSPSERAAGSWCAPRRGCWWRGAARVMTATGAPNVFVKGKGTYHGSLEVRTSSNGLDAINVGRARGLRPRRGLEGVAGLMADRGAQGAGRGRAFLRDLDRRPRHRSTSSTIRGARPTAAWAPRPRRPTRRSPPPSAGGPLPRARSPRPSSSPPPAVTPRTTSSPRSASGNRRFRTCAVSTTPTRPTPGPPTSTGSGSSRSAG